MPNPIQNWGRKTCNPIQTPDHKPYGFDQALGWEFIGLSRTLSRTLWGTVSRTGLLIGKLAGNHVTVSGTLMGKIGNPVRYPTVVNPTGIFNRSTKWPSRILKISLVLHKVAKWKL